MRSRKSHPGSRANHRHPRLPTKVSVKRYQAISGFSINSTLRDHARSCWCQPTSSSTASKGEWERSLNRVLNELKGRESNPQLSAATSTPAPSSRSSARSLCGKMNDDLVLVPARLGQNADESEYEELLPVSPP